MPYVAKGGGSNKVFIYRFQGVKHVAKNGIDLVATDGVSIRRTLLG